MGLQQTLRIGITDCSKYKNYEDWFLNNTSNIEVVKLSADKGNVSVVKNIDGLVLSGGEDVHPKYYNRQDLFPLLDERMINEKRDEFECGVIEKALDRQIPILGICRGLQIMNVYLGGSLVFDIPEVMHSHQHGKIQGKDQLHEIKIKENSLLYEIAGTNQGWVNSAHHQAIQTVANDLELIGTATDEPIIAEALQWKERGDKAWLLLVQWHPERMEDQDNVLAGTIRTSFITAVLNK